MTILKQENYFILSGAMGAGKSTVLSELKKLGLHCIDEPAREILAEQRAIGGHGTPEHNPQLFTELLLSRSIYQFKHMQQRQTPIIYDRGIPDVMGYATLFGLDLIVPQNAAQRFLYNRHVFLLPPWEQIYETDDERKMSFAEARQFGEDIQQIYQDLHYNVIEIPKVSPAERAKFILAFINALTERPQ